MYELIIIGAGPGGLTAALYAGRYKLKTLVLEKMAVGGQIIMSSAIENFPGFPGGIATEELISRQKKQVEELDVNIELEEAVSINESSDKTGYIVKTPEKEYQARSIIIASGAYAKRLGAPGEERLIGKGVSYCATCDGPLFKGKDIVVIGGGDKAIEEALFLTSYAKTVTIIHRRQGFRAAEILLEKARNNPKIKFMLDTVVEEVIGQERLEALKLKDNRTNAVSRLSCQGVFIFVGIKPNTDFLKGCLDMDKEGFVITGQDLKTSRQGIFACGDCLKKGLYQVVNACGEAAVAAYSAQRYLMESK